MNFINAKKKALILVMAATLSLNAFAAPPKPSDNISILKANITKYYNDGSYEKDLKVAIAKGITELKSVKKLPGNAAFVFDIDETALSNMPYEKNYDYAYIPKAWDDWIDSAKAPAIPAVKGFYDDLRKMGVKIIFITGRPQSQYGATYMNLRVEGYNTFDTLICKPPAMRGKKAVEYKSKTRKDLSKKYSIIGSIGDQASDLEGGFTKIKIKLPNYMYYIE
ncbi:MAG: HAD family acid phosphatase [Chloroflexota bacterium]